MGRLSRRLRSPKRTVAALSVAVLLTACEGTSSDVPDRDFAAPPFEPIKVPGPERCVGMERENSVSDDSDRLPKVDTPCFNEERTVDASQIAGPAVINPWASWCGPCRKEMPMLAEAARSNPDVQFVSVNVQDGGDNAAALLAETGVTYPQLVDDDAVVLRYTRVPGLPVTLALDADGVVVDRVIGEVSEEELATMLDSLTGPE